MIKQKLRSETFKVNICLIVIYYFLWSELSVSIFIHHCSTFYRHLYTISNINNTQMQININVDIVMWTIKLPEEQC